MMTPLTAFVLRHRRWIVGFWLLALVAGGVAAGKVVAAAFDRFLACRASPGYVAAQQIVRVYGNGGQRATVDPDRDRPGRGNGPRGPGPDRRGLRQAPGRGTPAPGSSVTGHRRSGLPHR